MREYVYAPWTNEQVTNLNSFQNSNLMHPFTCVRLRDLEHEDSDVLVATRNGWICPKCDFTQNWAHDFMAQRLYSANELAKLLGLE